MSGSHDALVIDLNRLMKWLKEQDGVDLYRADDPSIDLSEEIKLLASIIERVS